MPGLLVSEVFRACGAAVVSAGSGAEALRRMGESVPHLLVSDIWMPEQDGYALIRAVRALEAHEGGTVPAVALTALSRPEDRRQAVQAGYQVHIAKPVEAGELVEVVAGLADLSRRREAAPLTDW